jgi:hypothetical protein
MFDPLSGYYSVCTFCKEGKFNLIDNDMNTDFEEQHVTHGALEIVPGAKFLSENLKQNYIDVDRPKLEPINTSIGPSDKKDIIESFKSARNIRNHYLQQKVKKEFVGFNFYPVIVPLNPFYLSYEARSLTPEELLIPKLCVIVL